MIAIYDFDGTLTPYSLPQYHILKQCGYTDKTLMKRIEEEMTKNATNFYETYYKCFRDILFENGITMSRSNICSGAKSTKLNNGVEEYFKRFQSSKTGIKHYIVTSGIKDYVDETVIRDYVDGIYGVTFKQENGIFKNVDILLTDKKKVDIIQKIQSENCGTKDLIYFGDGLTDGFAFEYVHNIGGKNVFVASNEQSHTNYQKLNVNGIIDNYFDANFDLNSQISNYLQKQITIQRDEAR